jgi:predicted phosphodiesterase
MKQIKLEAYQGKWYRFGFVTDTQLGSKYEKLDLLNAAYKVFRNEGIQVVLHAGDLLDGEKMYRGQEYELHTHGFKNQVAYAVQHYPKFKGMVTYFILGNHDLSFYKRAGAEVGEAIAEKRKDMIYLGQEEADVSLNDIKIRLVHPSSGTAYAISYKIQKYIESLSGGQKPHIMLFGHYHKSEFLPCYRSVFAIQGGCLQGQTAFMRRMSISAHIGFWICEFLVDNVGSLVRFKAEFFAYYEEKEVKDIPENKFLTPLV